MTKSLDQDLRDRVIDAISGGQSCRAAADRFGIAPSTAIKWYKRFQQTQSRSPRPRGVHHRPSVIEPFSAEILSWINEQADITLREIQERLVQKHDQHFAIGTIWNCLHRHGMTFKKRQPTQQSKSAKT